MRRSIIALGCLGFTLTGCSDDVDVALWMLEPVVDGVSEVQLVMAVTELATDLDSNATHEEMAQQIKSIVEKELPCADVTIDGATVTAEYGMNDGNCTLHGMTLSGTHTITVRDDQLTGTTVTVVEHALKNVSNGRVPVSGGAIVPLSATKLSRDVQYWLGPPETIANAESGQWHISVSSTTPTFVAHGSGRDGELGVPFDVSDCEFRWGDPVPQQGRYVIDHSMPNNTGGTSESTVIFERVNDTTIEAKFMRTNPPDVFHVFMDGTIERVQE